MDSQRLHILEDMPVPKAIIALAAPAVLAMIVQMLYQITNTFFIGMLNDPVQMAAVSVSMPVFMMTMALAGIFGNGGASFLSRQLGMKDYDGAHRTATGTFYACGIVGIFVTIGSVLFLPSITRLIGASAASYHYAYRYLFVIFLGSPIIMLNFAAAQLLRAEGAAKPVMFGMLLGTIVNTVLDPVFILLLHWGVIGAAVGTVCGNTVGLLWYLREYWRGRSVAVPSLRKYPPDWPTYMEIIRVGLPTSLGQLTMSLANAITYKLMSGCGDNAVAALGITMRIFVIPLFTFMGLAIGIQPLVGYCYGAGRFNRMRQVMKTTIRWALMVAVGFTFSFALISGSIMRFFMHDPTVVGLGTDMLHIMLFALIFIAVQMPLMISLQAMGKALAALLVSISRQGLVYIPALFILNRYFGPDGIVATMPIADVATCALAVVFTVRIVRHQDMREVPPSVPNAIPESSA